MSSITKSSGIHPAQVTALALLFLTVCTCTASASRPNTPPDSYLPYKVYSVAQLIRQVESNPAIRKHYAETFHVPQARVVTYLRDNVVSSYVQETGKYTVYCVRPDGHVYPTVQHFQRGTKVFALRNGQPVMKWLCGNPLLNFLPAVHEVVKPEIKTITKVSPSVETLIPAQSAQQVVPEEEIKPVYQPKVPIMASPSALTAPLSSAVHISPLALLPVALLPTLGGHHSSTGGTTAGSTTAGSTTAGSTTAGSTTAGSTTAGSTTAGSTTAGSTTSGSTTSGSTTSGSTTSGSTTSGSTTSGSTTSGSTTSGSTTSGSTTSGSTTSGSTTSGTTTTTTTGGAVPEPASGPAVAFGCVFLAVGALIASLRKPTRSM